MTAVRERRVRTLVIDDEDDIRTLATEVIRIANQGLEVCGEADGPATGITRWRELQPDVIVLDQRMPEMTGLDVAKTILAENPAQPIILFSAFLDDGVIADALALGICSVLSKDRYRDLPDALWACAGF